MNTLTKVPKWYWVISILALIWNIMGVIAYLAQAYMTDEMVKAMPQSEQNFYNNFPAWVTAVFAIAVFSGTLGCIALLLRKKWAILLFIISMLAVFAQQYYNFFIQDFVELTGQRVYMPVIIVIFGFSLIWFSKSAKDKGWIS
ncbi:hypothetical protein [Aquimarina litoralis]|uniref:hypothetical protein n=1 Tax=Aquimarina litoralis TaxID=584605 RepID=UPI001C594AB1|nr:hypothetical protein [Aquimarina litoralis]MBW1296506.1 hypothetical protein [Aquimarina litoralis]